MINQFYLLYPITTYVFLSILFLAVGSLLNVIIYRLPIMLNTEWEAQCSNLLHPPSSPPKKEINLFFPRSFCPHCNSMIPIWFNIPIISFCILLGRCRSCKQKIPFRYPLIEFICLVLSIFAVWFFGFDFKLIFILSFIWILLCLFFIDLDHQILPDSLNLSLLWLGLIANTMLTFTTVTNAVLSAAAAYLFLWLFIKLFYLITGKIGMGNGDFKLFAALGAWFGWTKLPLILLTSSLTGAIIGIIYLNLTAKNRDTQIPFGPFLCVAGLITLFFGNEIIQWYIKAI